MRVFTKLVVARRNLLLALMRIWWGGATAPSLERERFDSRAHRALFLADLGMHTSPFCGSREG